MDSIGTKTISQAPNGNHLRTSSEAQKNIYRKPALDKIIKDNFESNQKDNKKASFAKKLLLLPTLSCLPLLTIVVGEAAILARGFRLNKLAKNSLKHKEKLNKFMHNLGLKLTSIIVGSMALIPVANHINQKTKTTKDNERIINKFNNDNNSSVELRNKNLTANFIGAFADPISAKVTLNDFYNEDFILSKLAKKHFLNHELVHMKQFMTMARAKNGINRLNYVVVNRTANSLDDNGKNEVKQAYNEIQSGINTKYKNATVKRFGYDINLVKYVSALHKVLFEDDANPNNVPIIINKNFYEQAVESQGPLTPNEEQKADKYFNAYINYPNKLSIFDGLNSKSDYKQNLMEKEAYSVTPWYIG